MPRMGGPGRAAPGPPSPMGARSACSSGHARAQASAANPGAVESTSCWRREFDGADSGRNEQASLSVLCQSLCLHLLRGKAKALQWPRVCLPRASLLWFPVPLPRPLLSSYNDVMASWICLQKPGQPTSGPLHNHSLCWESSSPASLRVAPSVLLSQREFPAPTL